MEGCLARRPACDDQSNAHGIRVNSKRWKRREIIVPVVAIVMHFMDYGLCVNDPHWGRYPIMTLVQMP